jgi:pilus assembly protein CpaF
LATDVRFNDDKHLMNIIDRIVSAVGRRMTSLRQRSMHARRWSRVNVIIPPLAIDGASVSIRFAVELLSMPDPFNSTVSQRGASSRRS